MKIQTECGEREVAVINLLMGNCDLSEFFYFEPSDQTKFNLIGDAEAINSGLYLTFDIPIRTGAVWRKERVPLRAGFSTNFIFRTSAGENSSSEENSLPGADGLVFVIQNQANDVVGYRGGGIGYSELKNAFAIEFDMFNNDSLQRDDFGDPDGNHIAVMISKDGNITSNHKTHQLKLFDDCILFEHNVDYSCNIEYSLEDKEMIIEVSRDGSDENHIYKIEDIQLDRLINLEGGFGAYVGFTSATGNAYQRHIIKNWHFCPTYDPLNEVTEAQTAPYTITENGTSLMVNFNEAQKSEISVYDINGKMILNENSLSSVHQISKNSFPQGAYYLVIKINNEQFYEKFKVSR